MENNLNKSQQQEKNLFLPVDIEIYDPPMCCPTGLCGPTIDQTLLDVSEMIARLQSLGFRIERYQMSSHPNQFIGNPDVMKLIRSQQLAALPIVMVHGSIISNGRYPTEDEIMAKLNRGI
jgi:hypothetical protein